MNYFCKDLEELRDEDVGSFYELREYLLDGGSELLHDIHSSQGREFKETTLRNWALESLEVQEMMDILCETRMVSRKYSGSSTYIFENKQAIENIDKGYWVTYINKVDSKHYESTRREGNGKTIKGP